MEQISIIHVAITGVIVVVILALISSRKVKRLSEELSKQKEKVTLATHQIKEYEEKYSQVIDIEAECERVKSSFEAEKAEIESKS
ncbi:hypothetical protein CGH25_20445, partial [Vibrio parahaemolyticus]